MTRPRIQLATKESARRRDGLRRASPSSRSTDRIQWWFASPPSDTMSEESQRLTDKIWAHRTEDIGPRRVHGHTDKMLAEGHHRGRYIPVAQSSSRRTGHHRPRATPETRWVEVKRDKPLKHSRAQHATSSGKSRKAHIRESRHQGGDHGLQTPAQNRKFVHPAAGSEGGVRGHELGCSCKCCRWEMQARSSTADESSEEYGGARWLPGRGAAAKPPQDSIEDALSVGYRYTSDDESEVSSAIWTTYLQSQIQGRAMAPGHEHDAKSEVSFSDQSGSTLKKHSEAGDTDTDWDFESPSKKQLTAAEVKQQQLKSAGSPDKDPHSDILPESGQQGKETSAVSGSNKPETRENTGESSTAQLQFKEIEVKPAWSSLETFSDRLTNRPLERSQSWKDLTSCGGEQQDAPHGTTTSGVQSRMEGLGGVKFWDSEDSCANDSDVSRNFQQLQAGSPGTGFSPRPSRSMPSLRATEATARKKRDEVAVVWDASKETSVDSCCSGAGLMGRLYEGLVNKNLRKITSDFAVVVGERLFPIHKFVLHAHSGFFREILANEETQSSMHFKLDGVREDVFQNLHDFMYLRKLKVTHEDFPALLAAAKQLQMKDVPAVLLEFLQGSFDLTNAMALYEYTEEVDCHPLEADAHHLMMSNFCRIVDDYSFLKIPVDRLRKILKDDCLVVNSEAQVYRAAQSWMLYDWKNRKCHTEDLMREVRFALLSDEMLLAVLGEMEKWNLLDIGNISRLMMDSLKYKMYKRLGHAYSSKILNTRPRQGARLCCDGQAVAVDRGWQVADRDSPVILLLGGAEETYSMHAYNPSKEEWQSAGLAPKPWSQAGMVEVNGTVYVCGGHDLGEASATPGYCVSAQTWCWNSEDKMWRQLAPMRTARVNHAAFACKGKIYAIGGMDGGNRILNSVECYDPLTESWTQKPSMPEGCIGMAHCEFQGLLWICGGVVKSALSTSNQGIITDMVQVYNPEKDKWYTSAKLRFPRAFAALATANNRMYLIGGKGPSQEDHQKHAPPRGISDVDQMDMASNAWTHFTDLILPRHLCCAITIGRHIYIIGGMSTATGEVLPFIERLDVVSRSLVRLGSDTNLPVKLLGIGGVVLPPNRVAPDAVATKPNQAQQKP